MGSIRLRKIKGGPGHLVIDFRYQGVRCREQTLLEDTPANRNRLQTVLDRIEREIAMGTFVYAKYFPHSKKGEQFRQQPSSSCTGTPLFRDFAETWMIENSAHWKRSVIQGYRYTLDGLLLPRFGHYEVGAVTKADILAFRTELTTMPGKGGKKRSPSRINNIMKPIRGIMNEAADRYDFANPVRNIRKLAEGRKDIYPFTLDEVMLLCREIRRDYQNYLITRFFTGMRSGEVDGLKWKYVDFDRGIIAIRETVVCQEEDTPKTQSSYRDIMMLPIVREALLDQHKYTGDGELVFCSRAGTPLHQNNFRRRIWRPLLARLGLPLRRPYETRHTAATIWLASGENPEWVARQLGHSNTEMLFRVYSRYIPNLTRKDGSAIRALVESKIGGKDDAK
ncbi:MAG: DUF3596 domain-containing protein [Mariprofundaceae bacterium]|nr:DUF3596 domain-containing protein [Mariprofundaceae bacterium]